MNSGQYVSWRLNLQNGGLIVCRVADIEDDAIPVTDFNHIAYFWSEYHLSITFVIHSGTRSETKNISPGEERVGIPAVELLDLLQQLEIPFPANSGRGQVGADMGHWHFSRAGGDYYRA